MTHSRTKQASAHDDPGALALGGEQEGYSASFEADPDLSALLALGARAGGEQVVGSRPFTLRSPRRGEGVTTTAAAAV